LNYHGESGSSLLPSARAARRRQAEDLSSNHSGTRIGCEVGHLLADDAHLFSIGIVGHEPSDLLRD
jgi:hypothetical protein